MKGLTTIRSLDKAELGTLVARGSEIRDVLDAGEPIVRSLGGLCVANVFFEPSTRTRLSFDLAAQRLGAHVITFDPETASTRKGESLKDTALTLSAIGADVLVVRHEQNGAPQRVAEWTGLPVVNAGDGTNEHPTQMLLDALTVWRHFGRFEGLRMGIVGDVAHSRVAGSLVHGMPTLGIDVHLVGPAEWLPEGADCLTSESLDGLLGDLDIVYLLRVQTERGGVITPEYVRRYQLDQTRSAALGADAVVLHAGPMNRGVEIAEEVAESPRCLVTEQVRNGVPMRMAVLRALVEGAL
jgi:aspartate carbamoyltransferase catalytic subunit